MTNDARSAFTEPSADKLLVNVGLIGLPIECTVGQVQGDTCHAPVTTPTNGQENLINDAAAETECGNVGDTGVTDAACTSGGGTCALTPDALCTGAAASCVKVDPVLFNWRGVETYD